MLLLFASWQVSQTDAFREQVQKLGGGGTGAIQLQLTGTQTIAPTVAVKPSVEPTPVKKKSAVALPAQAQEVVAVSPTNANPNGNGVAGKAPTPGFGNSEGSIYGTAKNGLTDVRSLYRAELRAQIEKNKTYPVLAKRLGQQGTVVVAFTLLEDGKIKDVKIDQPSRYEHLNASALEAVKKVEKFKPIPKEIGEAMMEIKVPINFKTI